MPDQIPLSPWEEHHFWLKILEDHAHFIHDYLSPSERNWVNVAGQYITAFRQLRIAAQKIDRESDVSSEAMITLAREIYPVALGYFQFEGHLQHLRTKNEVNLNLSPTYLNGTLDENQEYLRLLSFYTRGENPPPLTLIQLLDLWLADQAGHGYLLANGLDIIEGDFIDQTRAFIQRFTSYMLKNIQMKKYARFTQPIFPEQGRFARQVAETVVAFNQLVMQIVTLYQHDEIFTRLTLRFIEHHLPETCYFLLKLAEFLPEDAKLPPCQLQRPYFPTVPRLL